MNLRKSAAARGAVAIAGVDAVYCRRLLQNLRAANGHRPIATIAPVDDVCERVAACAPSVILFDLGPTPDAEGLATVSALRGLAKTIVLAGVEDDALAMQALRAGAVGFGPRDASSEVLHRAVQLVEAGEMWIGRHVLVRLIDESARRPAATGVVAASAQLTPRESELAGLVATGASNREIARQLSISVKTVKTHLTSIFRKHGVSSRLQLALAAGRDATPATTKGLRVSP